MFAPVQQNTFFLANHDIFAQDGDLISVDISNPAAPHMDGVLLNTHGTDNDGIDAGNGYDESGGDFNMWSAVQVDPTTLLVASTTVTEGDTQNGVGRINIVDISDPTHMAIVGHLDIPGTVHVTGLELVGNQLLVTASTGGYQQNFGPNFTNYGLAGKVVLATVDATAPRNPQLLHTQVVNRASRSDAVSQSRFASLGTGLYAFSNLGASTDKPELQVINAADPQNFGTGATVVPSDIADLTGSGNLIYTTSADGLIIYKIGVPPPVPVTADVQVPKNTVVAGSFNIAPTKIITSDPNFDTLEFDLSLPGGGSQTFTWKSTVTGLQAGQSQTIADGATVSFTSQGTPGMVTLPLTMVTGAQILGLSPSSQTVAPEASATYTVKVTNPTSSSDTFNLAVLGMPAGWVSLPASVTVAANSFVNATLTLTSAAFAALGDYGFTVTANDAQASVSGDLILAGQPPVLDPDAHGVVVTLTPVSATAGQGTPAVYTVQATNTGSADDSFTLSDAGLPAGVTALFSQTTIDVPPGVSNFRDVTLTLTPAPGTTAGSDPFTLTATSTGHPSIFGTTPGTLVVVNNGVRVSLNANSGSPGTTFQATITNTGTVTDTFDLSLASPAGLVASLGVNKVTLAAGASQMVTITTGAVSFAVPGALALTVAAKSEADPAVLAGASASLSIPYSTGLTASFSPATKTLAAPGTASFLLTVNNTGNTEDVYTATITGTNGPVAASLMGLDGQPTQTISEFRLPALSTGVILLQTNLAALGLGAVTVQVKSLGDGQTSDNTATVSTPEVPSIPTVQFATATQSVDESAGTFTVTVTLSAASSQAVTVPFTLGGSAVAGLDYSAVTASPLVIAAGATSATITGTLPPDPGASPTLTLTLGAPTNATLGRVTTDALTIAEPALSAGGAVVITDTIGGRGLTLMRTAGLGVGSVTYILGANPPVALTNVTSFTYDGQGDGDSMTVLFANGEPLVSGGVFFNGGTGFNALMIDAAGLPVRTASGTLTAGDPQTVGYANVSATNINNAVSVDAIAGPDTADRATAFTGLTAQERFVQALYLDELGRAGVKSELDGWAALFGAAGLSQQQAQSTIATGIGQSQEARDHLVRSWYVAYLGRAADGTEEQGWVNLLRGQTEEQVLSDILSSPEFYARAQTLIPTGSSDERYVQALYLLLLNRTGEAAGVASWLGGLPALGRQGVALGFLTVASGQEFRTDQFEGYYNALLHRPNDAIGLSGWVFSQLDMASVRISFEATPEFFTNG